MGLTSKQRRVLRAHGQRLKDDAHLGKAGPTDAFLAHVGTLLDRKELVKLRFDDVDGADRQALADEVSAMLQAECAGVVGRTMLLYRANESLDDAKRIALD